MKPGTQMFDKRHLPIPFEGDFSFLRVLIKIAISFLEQAFVPIEQLNDSLEEVMSPLNGGMVWSIYPVVLGEDTRNRQDRLQ